MAKSNKTPNSPKSKRIRLRI